MLFLIKKVFLRVYFVNIKSIGENLILKIGGY